MRRPLHTLSYEALSAYFAGMWGESAKRLMGEARYWRGLGEDNRDMVRFYVSMARDHHHRAMRELRDAFKAHDEERALS